jgi:hypothetical protein
MTVSAFDVQLRAMLIVTNIGVLSNEGGDVTFTATAGAP